MVVQEGLGEEHWPLIRGKKKGLISLPLIPAPKPHLVKQALISQSVGTSSKPS